MAVLCFKVSLDDSFSHRPHSNKLCESVILMLSLSEVKASVSSVLRKQVITRFSTLGINNPGTITWSQLL